MGRGARAVKQRQRRICLSVTFQRKLLFGFSLMVLPALLVGAEAIRSNHLERRALDALGQSMARTRTYAELETAMFDQSEVDLALSERTGFHRPARSSARRRGGGLLAETAGARS